MPEEQMIEMGEQIKNEFVNVQIEDAHDGSLSTEKISLEQVEDHGETLLLIVDSESTP